MRASGWLGLSVLIVAMLVTGCSGDAGVRYANGSVPSRGADTTNAEKPAVNAGNKADFEAVVAAVDQQMQSGGRWQYLSGQDRQKVDNDFSAMRTLFNQYDTVEKMDPAARDRLLASQNDVNAVLAHSDGNRLVCEYTRPVGTHFPVKTCKTYAQRERDAREAQDALQKQMKTQTHQTMGPNIPL